MIRLFRCDDRLIHGQFMTLISKAYDADNVIVVDDFTASNEILKTVFSTAVPKSMTAKVYSVEESVDVIKKAQEDDSNTIVLMKEPATFLSLINKIPDLEKSLNIGPMSSRKGTKPVTKQIHLLPEEAEAIKELTSKGVDVYFRQVPAEKTVKWEDKKHLFN